MWQGGAGSLVASATDPVHRAAGAPASAARIFFSTGGAARILPGSDNSGRMRLPVDRETLGRPS